MRTKKRIAKTVLIVFIAGVVIQLLFDPLSDFIRLSESLQARISLPGVRKKWESWEIAHYTFDIQGYVPLICIFGGNIEVKDGKVIQVGPRSDTQLSPGLIALSHPPLCNYQTYTMPLLFDEIDRKLRESPFSISQISFDLKYGFVSKFGFGSCGGRGLLNSTVSDCAGGFKIENFRVLDN